MIAAQRLGFSLLLPALLLANPGQAQINGALFTLPEERVYLDYLRQDFLLRTQDAGFNIEVVEIPEVPEGQAVEETSGPVEHSFGGIMTRRDGSRSVWLNGRLLTESELPESFSLVGDGQGLSLRIEHEGRIFLLRPGQTANLANGTISEAYQRVIQPAPAPVPATAALPADIPVATQELPTPVPENLEASPVTDAAGEPATAGDRLATLAETIQQLSPEEEAALANILNTPQDPPPEETEDETE